MPKNRPYNSAATAKRVSSSSKVIRSGARLGAMRKLGKKAAEKIKGNLSKSDMKKLRDSLPIIKALITQK